ncbi:hypothetical protein FHR71_004466 [Methylobacterium sp. RAS18]|nr:hypothetical protein [Methylobacterium sp. RAS18]
MASVAALRTVKVSYVSEGAEKFRSDAEAAAASQTNLAQQSERAALVSEQAARRQLSATTAFEKLRATVDPTVRALQQYERGLSVVDRALRQDASIANEAAEAQRLLQRRYDEAAAAANRLSVEQRALARDTIAAREAAIAQASAFQATLNQRLGVRTPSVGSDRASDFAAAAEAADRLRARYDPLFQAQRTYRADLTELRGALGAGILSEDAYTAAITHRKSAFVDQIATLGRVSAAEGEMAAASERSAAAARSVANASAGWQGLGAMGAASLAEVQIARARADANAEASRRLGGLGAAANQNAAGRRLRSDEITNLIYQGGDITAQLGSGSPLSMIALQQGPQIAQVFAGPGGASVKGAFSQAAEAVGGFLTRIGSVGIALGGVTLAAGVGTAALMSYRSAQTEAERALRGVGRASGVTLAQINALADGQSRALGLTRNATREVAVTFAATGRVGAEALPGALAATRGFAGFLGVDPQEGATALAGILADVSRGAGELADRYGLLSDAQAESIQRMDAQGNRLGAQKRLLDALRDSTRDLGQEQSRWARLGGIVSDAWNGLGSLTDRALGGTGGGTDEQIRSLLQDRLRAQQSSIGRAASSRGGDLEDSARAIAETKRELEAVEARITRARTIAQEIDNNRLSAEIGAIVRGLSPAEEALKRLEDGTQKIRSGLSRLPLDEQRAAQNALDGMLRSSEALRDNMKTGGEQFAASLRQAQFDSQTVGFTDRNRSAAQVDFDFKARAEQALSSGTASEQNARLQSLEMERVTRIQTLERQNQLDLNRTGGAFSRFDTTLQSQILGAARGSVSAEIIAAIAGKESSGNANVGYSKILGEDGRPSSAYGLGQITRGTAQEATRLGYLPQGFDRTDVATMAQGIAGVLQMKIDQNGGDLSRGIMAYRGSNDPSVNRSYLAEVLRKSGQMGDVSETGLARDQDTNARALKSANDNLRLNTELYGVNGARLEAQTRATEQYNALLARGVSAADAASIAFSGLSDKLVSVERAGRLVQFMRDDDFTRAQLGRDRIDQQAYAVGRSRFGDTISPEAMAAIGRTRDTLELAETKSLFTDGVTSFVTDLRRGGDAATALSNAFGNAADRLIAKVMDSAISSAFGAIGGGSGGGGIGGFLSGLFGGGNATGVTLYSSPAGPGFAAGGYTGAGGRLEPAGLVHRGEVVWSQGDVARVGGVAVAEAIRRGLPGYAAGGPVGAPAWMPPPANAAGGPASVQVAVNNAPADHTATATVTNGPQGPRVEVQLEKMLDGMIADGRFDKSLGRRFGSRAVGR